MIIEVHCCDRCKTPIMNNKDMVTIHIGEEETFELCPKCYKEAKSLFGMFLTDNSSVKVVKDDIVKEVINTKGSMGSGKTAKKKENKPCSIKMVREYVRELGGLEQFIIQVNNTSVGEVANKIGVSNTAVSTYLTKNEYVRRVQQGKYEFIDTRITEVDTTTQLD